MTAYLSCWKIMWFSRDTFQQSHFVTFAHVIDLVTFGPSAIQWMTTCVFKSFCFAFCCCELIIIIISPGLISNLCLFVINPTECVYIRIILEKCRLFDLLLSISSSRGLFDNSFIGDSDFFLPLSENARPLIRYLWIQGEYTIFANKINTEDTLRRIRSAWARGWHGNPWSTLPLATSICNRLKVAEPADADI